MALAAGFLTRLRMYAMVIGYVGCFKVPRFAINTLVPFVVADLGLDAALIPSLLAAFHPGYILSQLPGAAVARRSGAKFVGSVQLAGCVLLLVMMPRAGGGALGKRAAVAVLSALMCGLGVCQGPMSPVLSQLNHAWMPEGVERAIAFRATSLAHTAAPLFAALVTTRLGARLGWRAVCYFYAGATACFLAAWVAFAADKPSALPPPPPSAAAAPAAKEQAAEEEAPSATKGSEPPPATAEDPPGKKAAAKPWDWRLLTMKPSLVRQRSSLSRQ
eukprot:SAG22_NODE_1548_length_4150_cov_2.816095_7_plen_274_part_00